MADSDFPSLADAATTPAVKKGPPPPRQKKKQEKLALHEWLGDAPATGSWADEMDALPTGPSARQEMGVGANQLGGGFSRLGYGGADRMNAPQREEIPLPDAPPYTAFVGNLSFDLTETDISEYFGGETQVLSVRIVMDSFENKPKGFGYVEFKTREDLEKSLGANGSLLGSRPIRVTVAEPPRRSGGGFADRTDRGEPRRGMFDDAGRDEGRSMGDWTRSGPLPPLESRGPPPPRLSTPASSTIRTSNSDREPAADVDWSSARGGRFQPAPERVPSFGSGLGRTDRSASFERAPDLVSKADEVSQWRRPSQATSQGSSPRGGSPAASTPTSPAVTRRKLELAPRTISSASQGEPTSSVSSSKPSPFGNAAPVNTAEREKQIEDKLAASRSSVREPASRSVSGSDLTGPRSPRSTSGPRVDPFGTAKPIDTSARDKEVEEKLVERERRVSVGSTPPSTESAGTNRDASPPKQRSTALPPQSLRKEGFSYSKMASGTQQQNGAASPPVLPKNQFEQLAIEETAGDTEE